VHEVLAAWKKAQGRGLKPIPALFQAMDAVLDIQTDKLAIPRRFTAVMKEIWALQPRLEQRSGRRPSRSSRTRSSARVRLPRPSLRERRGSCGDRAMVGEIPALGRSRAGSMLLAPQPGENKRKRRRRRAQGPVAASGRAPA